MLIKGQGLKITQRIMMVYLTGFVLLAGFAALTVLSGTKIQATTKQLAQQEIPGLIAVSAYKTYLQRQTVRLYEFYATADYDSFDKAEQESQSNIAPYLQMIKALPQYARVKLKLEKQLSQHEEAAQKFTKVMRQPSVDWDDARSVLADFSRVSDEMNLELDALVMEVAENAENGAVQSNQQTETLINTALVLTMISLVVGVFAAYNSHHSITKPLNEVSDALTGIADRKDLTYRVKQSSHDEVGEIASAANKLLDEFQRLARALDSSSQELSKTAKSLIAASDEIPQDADASHRQMGSIKVISGKLLGLAETLQAQFRLLNF